MKGKGEGSRSAAVLTCARLSFRGDGNACLLRGREGWKEGVENESCAHPHAPLLFTATCWTTAPANRRPVHAFAPPPGVSAPPDLDHPSALTPPPAMRALQAKPSHGREAAANICMWGDSSLMLQYYNPHSVFFCSPLIIVHQGFVSQRTDTQIIVCKVLNKTFIVIFSSLSTSL